MTLFLAAVLVVDTAAEHCAFGENADAPVSAAVVDENGFRVHTVRSPYQAGETKISVLLPDRLDASRAHTVLFVLPVEAGDGARWGRALDEVKRQDLHNKHRLVCVYPTFSHVPWYADHPTDLRIRQESHLLEVVVPFVERAYPVAGQARGRWLVGFSKSGWGAFSLLLRNPDVFGKAAAWDAPLGTDTIERFKIGEIFGTRENFERYRVATLLQNRTKDPGDQPRLVLAGANTFVTEHAAAHELMTGLGIPHLFHESPKFRHAWDGGWLPQAVELLAAED